MEISRSVRLTTNLDPDPGGLKSYGSGSGTLTVRKETISLFIQCSGNNSNSCDIFSRLTFPFMLFSFLLVKKRNSLYYFARYLFFFPSSLRPVCRPPLDCLCPAHFSWDWVMRWKTFSKVSNFKSVRVLPVPGPVPDMRKLFSFFNSLL